MKETLSFLFCIIKVTSVKTIIEFCPAILSPRQWNVNKSNFYILKSDIVYMNIQNTESLSHAVRLRWRTAPVSYSIVAATEIDDGKLVIQNFQNFAYNQKLIIPFGVIWYIDKGVPNGKWESLREGGQVSFFGSARHFQFLICETETSKRLKAARVRRSDFKTFWQQLWKQQQQQKTNKQKKKRHLEAF